MAQQTIYIFTEYYHLYEDCKQIEAVLVSSWKIDMKEIVIDGPNCFSNL